MHFSPLTRAGLALGLLAAALGPQTARAQAYTETTLHAFTGVNGDGTNPAAGLVRDSSGNLYGTAQNGGTYGFGTVYEISSTGTYSTLHAFQGANGDGAYPLSGLVLDGSGNLYGTAASGGGANNAGAVFEITGVGTSNSYSTLHAFTYADGAVPQGTLVRDSSGNLFGTTGGGGTGGNGNVFEITSGGVYSNLHPFTGTGPDGGNPYGGLVRDSSGNLFGTTYNGGTNGLGTVFELALSNGTYTYSALHSFTNTIGDGARPRAGLVLDSGGNLYGTTYQGGANSFGIVFQLAPSNGTYTFSPLHAFTNTNGDGAQPRAALVLDSRGNLYGTTENGGTHGAGTVFQISSANGTPTETTLYSFTNTAGPGTASASTDGANPFGGVVLDSSGNLYGTTQYGGTSGNGTVFELSPPSIAHTYVSNAGIDTGSCSRAAPCATFAYALTKTLPGGTVTALNPGEYGPMTITQAVTVDGEGTQAQITITTGDGIDINAQPTDTITLRGLSIVAVGDGSMGIQLNQGNLVVDDCRVSGFPNGEGLNLSGAGTALVQNTTVAHCFQALYVGGTGLTSARNVTLAGCAVGVVSLGSGARVDLKESQVTQNSLFGLSVSGGATISASGCTITGNGTAVSSDATSIVRLTNNDIYNNTTAIDTSGGTVSTTRNNRRAGNANTTTPPAATDQPNRPITVQ